MCLLKYFLMTGDTFIVSSLALTSEAGSKHVRPDGPADSESGSEFNLSRFVGSSGELSEGLERRFLVFGRRSSLPLNSGPPWEAVDPFLLLAGPP